MPPATAAGTPRRWRRGGGPDRRAVGLLGLVVEGDRQGLRVRLGLVALLQFLNEVEERAVAVERQDGKPRLLVDDDLQALGPGRVELKLAEGFLAVVREARAQARVVGAGLSDGGGLEVRDLVEGL